VFILPPALAAPALATPAVPPVLPALDPESLLVTAVPVPAPGAAER